MTAIEAIIKDLETCNFNVSTDTRKDLSGSVFFALKGELFDGNKFTKEALQKGALGVVTDDPKDAGEKMYIVPNVLKTLQDVAKIYRKKFNIPVIAIGGSNGKTTSKELLSHVLKTSYKTHATTGSLNNHIGVPLSILSMDKKTEIAVFEIGANHAGEHLDLLEILTPTHVVVTNNGMDHLEGFGSPEGSRKANKEIYDWAILNKAEVFVDKNQNDLMEDSLGNKIILYPDLILQITKNNPLTFTYEDSFYTTNLAGNYNLKNIELTVAIGKYFKIDAKKSLEAVQGYTPNSKRSEFQNINGVNFIVDCYNANPTSMMLALESFITDEGKNKGVILGDMLELGDYSNVEHEKIVDIVFSQNFDQIIFIGEKFKKSLENKKGENMWFSDPEDARKWFWKQDFKDYTFLLKGSRGIKLEKIIM